MEVLFYYIYNKSEIYIYSSFLLIYWLGSCFYSQVELIYNSLMLNHSPPVFLAWMRAGCADSSIQTICNNLGKLFLMDIMTVEI